MIKNAKVFATAAHEAIGQVRKYTGEPYITHPEAVAGIVSCVRGHTYRMIVAAWLHDTVEDTKVRIETIRDIFGDTIAYMVADLTNVPKEAGNRAKRHALD